MKFEKNESHSSFVSVRPMIADVYLGTETALGQSRPPCCTGEIVEMSFTVPTSGGFLHWDIPQMENLHWKAPLKIDDLGVPKFYDTSIYVLWKQQFGAGFRLQTAELNWHFWLQSRVRKELCCGPRSFILGGRALAQKPVQDVIFSLLRAMENGPLILFDDLSINQWWFP